MLVSSTSMKVAMETVTATSQGFTAGRAAAERSGAGESGRRTRGAWHAGPGGIGGRGGQGLGHRRTSRCPDRSTGSRVS